MNRFIKTQYAITLLLTATGAVAAGDAARGMALYENRCVACHSIEFNGVGPAHRGIYGRKAGGRADYAYSPALNGSNIVWAEKTLDRWLANPERFIPGQKMGLSMPSAKDRADIIAYLKAESGK